MVQERIQALQRTLGTQAWRAKCSFTEKTQIHPTTSDVARVTPWSVETSAMARFNLNLITDHLPRIGRRRTAPVANPGTSTPVSKPPLDYWAVDCAVNPWRKGCKDFDV